MNELQRQQYLDAMGIDTYMPRWILPAAPAPVACDVSFLPLLLEAPLAGIDASVDTAVDTGVENRVESRADPRVAMPAPHAAPAVAATAPRPVLDVLLATGVAATPAIAAATRGESTPTAEPLAAPQPAVEFVLSVWRVSPQLMVIDTRKAQLALPTDALLGNILLALGYPPQPLPPADILRWPPANSPSIGKTAADAREWLDTFLEIRLHADPVQHLLLMGEACLYILPEGSDYETLLGHAVELPALQTTAVVVCGLSDMLLEPLRKRQTWQALQPLRQDLPG
jgi:hypothetical protein